VISTRMTAGLMAFILLLALPGLAALPDRQPTENDLVGLWRAKRHFGPDVKGMLTLERSARSWTAEVAGLRTPARLKGDMLMFELPGDQGAFRGGLTDGRIVGHWIQPRTVADGCAYATPVTLEKAQASRWQGTVAPLEDELTLFLLITPNADGTLGAFIRNPERNLGVFLRIERVALAGRTARFLGRQRQDGPEQLRAEGIYDRESDSLALSLPSRGGTFDFRRASPADEARFYPRSKEPPCYIYYPPPAEGDGWPVASLDAVGISREAISRFVQMLIDTPVDSVHCQDIHGVLIARHGRLVLEEYFHGSSRDELHDTRSASKSLTSVLTGAAILSGVPVKPSTRVYETMTGSPPPGPDPRKAAITVENLLTMSSGLDCDDSDPNSAGNEDTMQEQTAQPDWYRYTLDLKMARAPGEKAVYGSAMPNLLGGILARTAGRWLPDLVRDLVAEPLGIRRYALNLTPTGDAYMGGGARFLPRDFMKLGQLLLDGGRWRGRRIVSKQWARKSTEPLYEMTGIHYGYLWWVADYPYKKRTVRAFFAGGNGGQIVMGIPELDLVIAFYGGNYSDPVMYTPQRVYVPEHILPAVN
jgi:CubicO group peptidase (beta-lactamase class C family)